jgi:branched-chain amino acid transport system substrate-binding protein
MDSRHVRGLFAVLLGVLLVLSLGACTQTEEPAEETETTEATGEPIKIGAVVSLTGVYAGLGEPEKNTLEMEVARINEAGGVNGRPVEVIIEDDATDEAKAVAATSKLIDQDEVVAIIGATGTGQSMAMRSEVNRASIPQVSMAGGTVITGDFDPLVFQTPWSNTLVVPFELAYLQEQGLTKVGLITDTGGFGKDGAAVIKENVDEFGIEIVSEQTFNPGDTDMTAQLTNIKNSGADVVLMWSAGAEAATVAQNMDQLGMEIPLFGSHGNARREFIEGAGEAAEGFRFAAGKILVPAAYGEGTEEYTVATDFITNYETEFGAAPSTFAGHAYDALYIITEAASRVDGDITPETLRDEIENTAGFVGIGGTFNYSADDHNGLTENDLVFYEVQDGDWVVVE